MKKLALFLLATLLLSCQSDKASNAQEDATRNLIVQLVCEDIGSDDLQPFFGVYAIINESKTKLREITAVCEAIPLESYADYEIPGDALSAVGGWWAGGGDYFYAAQAAGKVTFYHATVDEMQEAPIVYQPIATFEDGRFSVRLPGD